MECFSITSVPSDTTKILSCRKGDILSLVQDTSSIWALDGKYKISDFWVMTDVDSVLLSNRIEDIPEWFPLTHTMVGGRQNCRKMVEKLNNGYIPETHGIDVNSLPNIWKINVWNYIIWSGEKRPDIIDYKGVLGIFRFETGTLAIHQSKNYDKLGEEDTSKDFENALTPDRGDEMKGAFDFIESHGKARRYAEKWKLG